MNRDFHIKVADGDLRIIWVQIVFHDHDAATIVAIELLLKGIAGAGCRQYRPRCT
jgi:hypothetical protein